MCNDLSKAQKHNCFCENSNIKIGYQFLCCYFLPKLLVAYLGKTGVGCPYHTDTFSHKGKKVS